MPTHKEENDRIALLQGTLDLLDPEDPALWRLPRPGHCPQHSKTIRGSILRRSRIALPRPAAPGGGSLISAKWGVSENKRKARFYTLTARGRSQLTAKADQWNRLTRAMNLILSPSNKEA